MVKQNMKNKRTGNFSHDVLALLPRFYPLFDALLFRILVNLPHTHSIEKDDMPKNGQFNNNSDESHFK